MVDRFEHVADTVMAPASSAVAIVPDDSASLPSVPKAIYVGTGGDLVLRGPQDSADHVWRNIPDGAIVPFRATHVRATGTTAADMLALY